jgi:hypothetical protein
MGSGMGPFGYVMVNNTRRDEYANTVKLFHEDEV